MQKLKKEHLHKAETPARASGKDGNFSADDGKPKKEDKTMMTIKVNFKDDYTITRINGTPKEIAEHYFSQPDVESIDILGGGLDYENEYFRRTLTKLYRVSPEEQKEFDLYYNIRAAYKVEYRSKYKNEYENYKASRGFLRIA